MAIKDPGLTEQQLVDALLRLPQTRRERVIREALRANGVTPRPRYGSAKADITYMADDFDAPLPDFADYS